MHSHNIEIKDTAPRPTGDVMHRERQTCEEQLHFKKLETRVEIHTMSIRARGEQFLLRTSFHRKGPVRY